MLRDTREGYESRHDSRRHPESEGAAEDAQEDAKGLEQRRGLEAVAVVSCRLVGHDRAAGGHKPDRWGGRWRSHWVKLDKRLSVATDVFALAVASNTALWR